MLVFNKKEYIEIWDNIRTTDKSNNNSFKCIDLFSCFFIHSHQRSRASPSRLNPAVNPRECSIRPVTLTEYPSPPAATATNQCAFISCEEGQSDHWPLGSPTTDQSLTTVSSPIGNYGQLFSSVSDLPFGGGLTRHADFISGGWRVICDGVWGGGGSKRKALGDLQLVLLILMFF